MWIYKYFLQIDASQIDASVALETSATLVAADPWDQYS
jgi:hypothetical protein